MSSLTESSLIFDMINNNIEPKGSKKWYNRVYLCLEETNLHSPNRFGKIIGFNCYRYNSLENANVAFDKDVNKYNKMKTRCIIIPICKWIPQIFDKYILDWKLKNIYWLGKNKIFNNYSGVKFKKF